MCLPLWHEGLLRIFLYLKGDVLGGDFPALLAQAVLGGNGCGYSEPHYNVYDGEGESYQQDGGYNGSQSYGERVADIEVGSSSRAYATQYFVINATVVFAGADVVVSSVIGVAGKLFCLLHKLVQVLLKAVSVSHVLLSRAGCAVLSGSAFTGYLLGIPDGVYNLPDGLDVDGVHACLATLPEEFGYAMFYVIGYLFTAFLAAEVAFHTVQVVLQHVVGILVYII